MEFVQHLLLTALDQVLSTLLHNWPLLLASALLAAMTKVFVAQDKLTAFVRRNRGVGILGATGIAVATPLCSCGTTAVILGMMASSLSWAPIVAFMVSSPLTSPQELLYSASLFGWPFALTFFVASILLGLAGGFVAYMAENRGWLKNQTRFLPETEERLELLPMAGAAATSDSCCAAPSAQVVPPVRPVSHTATAVRLGREFLVAGRRLLLYFLGFAFIGYVLNGLIPESWVRTLFGGGRIYGVPLAATLGLPLYINTDASLPLVRSLMDLGMSPGATLAFLITGAGTSIGAITGALTIARWRVVGIVVGTLWAGAILIGYGYSALSLLGLFGING